jgi:hypothetical protein
MNMSGVPTHAPVLYEIRVVGALDSSWSELAEDLSLTVAYEGGRPVTVLRVVVLDQAALAGLLEALFQLNITVLSVEALETK